MSDNREEREVMYARVSTYEGSVEDYDASLEKMRSDIAPQVRKMPG